MVECRVKELLGIMSDNFIKNASIIEIGPGQSSNVIINLSLKKNVRKAYAVDLVNYFDDEFWLKKEIYFLYKDTISIRKKSINFIYCYDVLEHVKKPNIFLKELRRIVVLGGFVFFSWDLRDHLFITSEEDWFDMHKYSNITWSLQMSNRTSYVNRLDINEWVEIFKLSGFEVSMIETLRSDIASDFYEKKYNSKIDSTYRAKVILKAI